MKNPNFNEDHKSPLARFELMLHSNQVSFFDATEFEDIVQYYIDSGSLRLAYKALEINPQLFDAQHFKGCAKYFLEEISICFRYAFELLSDISEKLQEL